MGRLAGAAPGRDDRREAWLGAVAAVLRERVRSLAESARAGVAGADEVAADLIRVRLCLPCPRRPECWGGGGRGAGEVIQASLRGGVRRLRASAELHCVTGDALDLALGIAAAVVEVAERRLRERQETCLAVAAHLWELARSL